MDQLFFLGTIHENITPPEELIEMIDELQPDTLLVEITQEAIESQVVSMYPPEMQAALEWAGKKNVPVYGFDEDIDIHLSEIDEEQMQTDLEKQKQYFRNVGWKEANKAQHRNNGKSFFETYCDMNLFRKRQDKMAKNIKKYSSGKTVVITGAAHIEFFSKEFPQAKFPLR